MSPSGAAGWSIGRGIRYSSQRTFLTDLTHIYPRGAAPGQFNSYETLISFISALKASENSSAVAIKCCLGFHRRKPEIGRLESGQLQKTVCQGIREDSEMDCLLSQEKDFAGTPSGALSQVQGAPCVENLATMAPEALSDEHT